MQCRNKDYLHKINILIFTAVKNPAAKLNLLQFKWKTLTLCPCHFSEKVELITLKAFLIYLFFFHTILKQRKKEEERGKKEKKRERKKKQIKKKEKKQKKEERRKQKEEKRKKKERKKEKCLISQAYIPVQQSRCLHYWRLHFSLYNLDATQSN